MVPSTRKRTSSSRLQSVDALREAAALAVVITHAVLHARLTEDTPRLVAWAVAILRRGDLDVSLFFVISGFCIHLSAASGRAVRPLQFWKRRLRRLYPAYFGALVASMLIVAALIRFNVPAAIASYPQPRWRFALLDFASHASMLHGVIPQFDHMGGNPPFWSLAREEYYYALYLPLLVLARKNLWAAVSLAFVISGLASAFTSAAAERYFSALLSLTLWSQWILGMISVEAYFGRIALPSIFKRLWLVPVWAAAGFYLEQHLPSAAPFLFGICFFQLINGAVDLEKRGQWPDNRIITWLSSMGVFSYSLYLVHHPIVSITSHLLGPFGGSTSPLPFFCTSAIICFVSYWTGKGYFEAVERHFLNKPAVHEGKAITVVATASV